MPRLRCSGLDIWAIGNWAIDYQYHLAQTAYLRALTDVVFMSVQH
jgi:hypothetical protein